jgi:membrane-associated HD superfamily phosphohydrolase
MSAPINSGYSKITLEPLDKKTAEQYRAFTRSQVRNNSIKVSILLTVFAVICLATILKQGDFKTIKKKITSDLIIFFLLSGLIVTVMSIFLVARKFPIVTELVIPVYCFFVFWFAFQPGSKMRRSPS